MTTEMEQQKAPHRQSSPSCLLRLRHNKKPARRRGTTQKEKTILAIATRPQLVVTSIIPTKNQMRATTTIVPRRSLGIPEL